MKAFPSPKQGRISLIVAIVASIAISFAATINLIDDDALLTSKKYYSLHFWIAKTLFWSPYLLLSLNITMMVYVLRKITLKSVQIPVLFLLVNPFVVFNTLDAFNKFSTIAFLSLLLGASIKKRKSSYESIFILVIMTMIHPISFLSSALLIPIFWYPILFFVYWMIGNTIPESLINIFLGDKADLLSTYGTSLASSSGGNYKLIESTSLIDLGWLAFDPYAPLRILWYPAFMESSPTIKDYLLSAYMLVGFLSLFFLCLRHKSTRSLAALFIIMSIVPVFVGNIAVIFRHILPLMPAIIMLQTRNNK